MPIDGRNAYQATWVRLFAAHQAWLHGEAKKAADVIDGTGPAISLATLPPEAQGSVATQLQPMYLMLGQLRRAREIVVLMRPPIDRRISEHRTLKEAGDKTAMREAVLRMYPTLESSSNRISTLIDAGLLDRARDTLALVAERTGVPPAYLTLMRGKLA